MRRTSRSVGSLSRKGDQRPLPVQAGQERHFLFQPNAPIGVSSLFQGHFRGRGWKKRQMAEGSYDGRIAWGTVKIVGGHEAAPRRLPDIDDPRPPIIGWSTTDGDMDFDGTLPFVPFELHVSEARKILQGRYCDFKELWNYHETYHGIYGCGQWAFYQTGTATVHPSCALVGMGCIDNRGFVHNNCIMRGDLNTVDFLEYTYMMDGCVLTTDGHPRNTNKPGRISKITEGVCALGSVCWVHPNVHMDACVVAQMCEIGEGCRLGNGSLMERYTSLEPGSVLLANQRVPRFEIWGGHPATRQGFRMKDMNGWCNKHWAYGLAVGQHYTSEYMGQYMGLWRSWGVGCEGAGEMTGCRNIATRQAIGEIEDCIHTKLKQHYGKMPEKAKEYIGRFTADIPLWELYKNMSRANFRPGVRKEFGWTVDPKRARWVDHF